MMPHIESSAPETKSPIWKNRNSEINNGIPATEIPNKIIPYISFLHNLWFTVFLLLSWLYRAAYRR